MNEVLLLTCQGDDCPPDVKDQLNSQTLPPAPFSFTFTRSGSCILKSTSFLLNHYYLHCSYKFCPILTNVMSKYYRIN